FSSLGEGGEEMKIELNTGQGNRLELEATPGPLFRWIHLKGEAMDFDDFIILRPISSFEPGRSNEKGIIKQHLRRLRNPTEKPLIRFYFKPHWTPVGYQGRYMEPTMIQELNLQSATSKSHLDTSVIALCLPYFLLDEYSLTAVKAFTANFMEIKSSSDGFMSRFEDQFRVMMKGKTVTAKDWSRILSIAHNSTVRLFLYRKRPSRSPYILTENVGEEGDGSSSESENMFPWQMEHPPPPPDLAGSHSFEPCIKNEAVSRNPSVPNSPQIIVDGPKSEPEPTSVNNFHVFSWLSRQNSALEAIDNLHEAEEEGDTMGEKKIKADLDAIHQILSKSTNQKEMKAYQDCREKRLPEVVKLLALVTQVNGQLTPGISIVDKFFIAATDMYELFIPLDIETKVGFRYWGAVHFILKKSIPRDQPSLIKSIEKFILVSRLAKIIKEELSGTRGPKPEHAELPEEFQTAWLHCIVYLVLFRVRAKNVRDRDRHIEKCQLLLYRGRQNLARKLGKMRLEKKEVAVPQVVLSVLIFRLLKDITPDPGQLDLYRTYWEYWDQLEAEVQTHRIERAQPEISDLRQEITAVTKALDNQLSVLDALREGFLSQRAGWSYLNNGDRKHEVSVIKECISHVENRIRGFEEMGFRANELESWNTQKIASTKDRQDKAIYAFTIVTIIFLPLSFVSGFLGMNTTDIRNSNSKQWVFWASGLPLTAVVILVALLWAGELGNAWRAVANLFPTQKRGSGYMRIRDQQKKWYGSSAKKTKPYLPSPPSPIPPQPPRLPTQEPWDKPYRRTETYKSTA
ncbi:uncharacterized protein K441DRAFT_564573, partial [Cenococcum geophilum 1.58]|uniref:uncharacterized protein n=1 Tax=Cenococcum geophilum 1.58 TaxID=794803 RepID=UPI00358DFB81